MGSFRSRFLCTFASEIVDAILSVPLVQAAILLGMNFKDCESGETVSLASTYSLMVVAPAIKWTR